MKYALTVTANFHDGDEEYDVEGVAETLEDIGPTAVKIVEDKLAIDSMVFSSLVIVVVPIE